MAKKVAATLSDDLYEAGNLLRRARGYRNWSEYLASFVRHDCMVQTTEHGLTEPIAAMEAKERDEMDAKLLEMVKSGKGERGSWLRKVIYDTIKELMVENGGYEPMVRDVEKRLSSAIVNRIKKGK
jgi:predicted TIM-barrel enzyme